MKQCATKVRLGESTVIIKNDARQLAVFILTLVIFCAGMAASMQNRWIALLATAVLAIVLLLHVFMNQVSISRYHVPLVALPILFLLSSLATNGLTWFAFGQVLLFSVPLMAALVMTNQRNSLIVIAIGAVFLALVSLSGEILPFIRNTITPAGFNSSPRVRLQTILWYANVGAVMFGCGIFALLGIETRNNILRATKWLLIVLLAVCIFLTGSRTIISFMIVLPLIYVLHTFKAWRAAVVLAFILSSAVVLILIFNPRLLLVSELAYRFIYWWDAVNAFINQPLWGLGPEGYVFNIFELQSAIYRTRLVHNAFVQIAVDAGVFALIALCCAFAFSLIHNFRINKSIFFINLLILLHSFMDSIFIYFPTLFIFGICCSRVCTAEKKAVSVKKRFFMYAAAASAALFISVTSLYISVGERFYSVGLGSPYVDGFESPRDAYRRALQVMPQDFRATIELAWVYILRSEHENAVELLMSTDSERFNRGFRYKLLTYAYKGMGCLDGWNYATLAFLKYAPMYQFAFNERREFLIAAYRSNFINVYEFESEFSLLMDKAAAVNESLPFLTQFFVERDRAIRLEMP